MIGMLLVALLPVAGSMEASAADAPETGSRFTLSGQNAEDGRHGNAARRGAAVVNPKRAASYLMSGEKSLRPVRIGDDGTHMYLEWGQDQALPAVFALNALGEEEMVDGYMRAGVFTIDRVYRNLVFRISRKHAQAKRVSK